MQVPFKICREVDSQDLRRFDSHQLLVLHELRGELRFFFSKGDDEVFALRAFQLQLSLLNWRTTSGSPAYDSHQGPI